MSFDQFIEFASEEASLMKKGGVKAVNPEFAIGKLLGMWKMFKIASDYTAQEYEAFFDETYMDLLDDFI